MISLPCLFDLINAIYNGMTCHVTVTPYPTLQHIHFLRALHFFQEKICNKELQNVLFKQIVNVLKINKLCHIVHTKNLYCRNATHSLMLM